MQPSPLPFPDENGKDLATHPTVAQLVRLGRFSRMQRTSFMQLLRASWDRLNTEFSFGEAGGTPLETIWLSNLGFLVTQQFVADTRISWQRPMMPYAIANGSDMTLEDSSTFFVAAFALALVDGPHPGDPFYVAATRMGQITCDDLNRDYTLEERPLPGMGRDISEHTSPVGDNLHRWYLNLTAVSAQFNTATVPPRQPSRRERGGKRPKK